jgi:hypothetical protein
MSVTRYGYLGPRGRRAFGTAVVAGTAIAVLPSPALAPAASSTPPVSPADAAATAAYLEDVSAFGQSLVANAPKSRDAVAALAERLGSECPGVLHGAPTEPAFSSASTLGEARRALRQLGDLRAELVDAIAAAYEEPDDEATTRLVSSLSTLQWSNLTLTSLVQALATSEQERLEAPALDVCADMAAWASSDYKTLSAGTTAFLARREADRARTRAEGEQLSIAQLLAQYESSGEKALARRIKTLDDEFVAGAVGTLSSSEPKVEEALGIHSPLEEGIERAKHATVIAHGRTAAGERFVAKAERATAGERGCKLTVSIENPPKRKAGLRGTISFSTGGECLSSKFSGPQASVRCDSGLLRITALAPASARTARLMLSNGREITSRVIRAPRLGGRAGYYYQVVRGPSPIPVSLTELSASDSTLRVVELPRVIECTKHPDKYLPGGRPRRLARGRAPEGPRFTIVGERFSYLGHVRFELKVNTTAEHGEGRGAVGGSSSIEVGGPPPPFSIDESTGCNPHLYDIVYGVLKPPGASVLVRISGVLTPLHEARIPAGLHAGGVLAYGAFAAAPTQLIVRDARGRTLISQSMTQSAKQTDEECEGEAE